MDHLSDRAQPGATDPSALAMGTYSNPWRQRLDEIQFKLAQGRIRGMAESMGELLDVLAFFCILRLEELKVGKRQGMVESNGEQRGIELPDCACWETLVALPPERLSEHIGQQLFPILQQAPETHPLRQLPRLFQPNRFSPAVYESAMTILSSLPFAQCGMPRRGSNLLVWEDKVIEFFTGWKGVGEFVTPGRVADLMIDLAAPQLGERIYNPCAGFGTLLVRAFQRTSCLGSQPGCPLQTPAIQSNRLFGIEVNHRLCLLALAHLMLAGIPQPQLELGDVLQRPQSEASLDNGFDCILCATPIGAGLLPEQAARFNIRTHSVETLILQHILARLRPGGRAVVLMPESFLYRGGAEVEVRKRLLCKFHLEAVVALPEHSIYGLGPLRTCLLVVHRREPAKTVAFITSESSQKILRGYHEPGEANKNLVSLLENLRPPATESSNLTLHEEYPSLQNSISDKTETQLYDTMTVKDMAKDPWTLTDDFLSNSDKIQVLLSEIQHFYPKTEIRTLRDAGCDVGSGMRIKNSDLLDVKAQIAQAGAEEVRLVRMRDLPKPGKSERVLSHSPTMARLKAQVAARVPAHCFLREGDILVPRDITKAGIAVVGSGNPSMIAAASINVIRTPNPSLHTYLFRLLMTQPYQRWFLANSLRRSFDSKATRIATPTKDLRNMPVPVFSEGAVPDALLQLRYSQSLESIVRLLEGKSRFSAPVRFLLEDDLVLDLTEPVGREPMNLLTREKLVKLVQTLEAMRSEATFEADEIPLLSKWFNGFHGFASRLLDILELPMGSERFSALQAWKLSLDHDGEDFLRARQEFRQWVQKRSRNETASKVFARAEALLEALVQLWQADSQEHLENTRLSATLSPALVTEGVPTEVSVALTNEGTLPLRKLTLETRPFESRSQCNLLRPGSKHEWFIHILAQENGRQTLQLHWTGRQMDESETSGEVELAIEVGSERSAAEVVPLQCSPYVVGSPIDPKSKLFFGREDIIQQINRTLRTEGPSTIILLEGNRRVGKSSLLKRLASGNMPPEWIPVYVSFQGFGGKDDKAGMATEEIFYGIAKELIIAAAKTVETYRVPDVDHPVPAQKGMLQTSFFMKQVRHLFRAENAFEMFRLIVESVLTAVNPRRILLMLDEFDKIQEGIDNAITSPQLPENLRNVFHSYDRVSGILTGSRTIRRLRREYWNVLFGLGISIAIKGLDEESACRLVTEPVKGQLVYTPTAVDCVVKHCARQPFLIQGLCHSIFEQCAVRGERSVTPELAAKAAEGYAQDNEHFRSVWDQIDTYRRRYLVCLVDELASLNVPVTLDFLRDSLERRGILYRAISTLTGDLEELVALEVLGSSVEQRQRTYRIEIPIFSEWLRRNVDGTAQRLEAIHEMEVNS
ncbi:MAG TPA: N-6 DNA methylase [Candidatus Paceibacterota bacterium]|nr:N-6 DNA methylase [Verrucomicrobiota bacterium]HRY47176.1 N-6 DNA methylase [Candidatus Paceibacterota bacterium]